MRLALRVESHDELRTVEVQTIREFVTASSHLLAGRTLDFGCGRQPYRKIVETAGGTYVPFDRAAFPANVSREDVGVDETLWGDLDAILCTQAIQYFPDPADTLGGFCDLLRGGDPGVLVMTGPTTWPVVESEDLHRFTVSGVARVLRDCGFRKVSVEDRWALRAGDLTFVVGWQAVAYA